jgi:cell wall-associated NlpC family hydrolase
MKKFLIASFIINLCFGVLAGCDEPTTADKVIDYLNNSEELATENSQNEPEESVPEGTEQNVEVEEVAEAQTKTYIQSLAGGLNVRKSASTSGTILGTLDKGDRVVLVEAGENWHTTFFRGQTAYVTAKKSYVLLIESEIASEQIESVISVGEKFLGTEYVYGAIRLHNGYGVLNKGFTSTKFDCSSLMQYIFYYGANVNLQLTTRTQIYQGEYVAKSDLQRGDLIFFTNASRYYYTGIERVGHVALYLGDGYILHTASDHAVIEKISTTRSRYYIESRRMI